MPIHDFACAECGTQLLDVYQPRQNTSPPLCPNLPETHTPGCDLDEDCVCEVSRHQMERLWTLGNSHTPFAAFTTEVPTLGTVMIDSMKKLRDVERKTSEAGTPWAVRQFSMDRSNRNTNTFGPPPNQRVKTRTKRGEPFIKTSPHYTGSD